MHDDLERIAGTTTVPGVNCVNGSQQTVWSQTFSFDAFGNINKSGNSSFSASYSPSTNRMTTIGSSTPTYDANGNVTNDFLHTYAWDAEGRPVTIDTVGATYDALGRMVEQNRSGTYTEIAYAPTGGKLALMSGQTLQKAFVPLPGGATAVYTSSGLDHYRHSDWLGSTRLATTASQTVYGDVAYAPYGETYAASGNNDFSWTGINADVEPANPETLYDFPAREYGIQGRWPSPDPLGLGAANPGNPQSWNRYAYVMGNPLAMTDPTGMEGGPCADPISCLVINILGGLIFHFLFGHHHHHVTPHAPPAPDGGYGGGIDPYGTWDEKIPGGVQVFPHVGFPGFPGPSSGGSGCTYGSGYCGGTIYGIVNISGSGAQVFETPSGFVFAITVYALLEQDSAPAGQAKPRSLLSRIGGCAAEHYGLTGLAVGAAALGLPVPKALLSVGSGLAGASESTSVAGAIGFKLFGAAEPRLGTAILGTTRVFGIVGRAAPFISAALFAYDVASIGYCAYKSGQ
jgi:RHS repeat-associated protein